VFSLLWEERDTRIYAVPRPVRTIAHVIPEGAVVRQVPAGLADQAQMKTYIAATEASAASAVSLAWLGNGHARIHATLDANRVLALHVTYHPGWKATAGARTVLLSKDGLGQLILSADHPGDYDIDLLYDGGWESKLCRATSALTWLALVIAVWRSWACSPNRRKRATPAFS
jgi:hypothetical protein